MKSLDENQHKVRSIENDEKDSPPPRNRWIWLRLHSIFESLATQGIWMYRNPTWKSSQVCNVHLGSPLQMPGLTHALPGIMSFVAPRGMRIQEDHMNGDFLYKWRLLSFPSRVILEWSWSRSCRSPPGYLFKSNQDSGLQSIPCRYDGNRKIYSRDNARIRGLHLL